MARQSNDPHELHGAREWMTISQIDTLDYVSR